jgi:hypothetical protein
MPLIASMERSNVPSMIMIKMRNFIRETEGKRSIAHPSACRERSDAAVIDGVSNVTTKRYRF